MSVYLGKRASQRLSSVDRPAIDQLNTIATGFHQCNDHTRREKANTEKDKRNQAKDKAAETTGTHVWPFTSPGEERRQRRRKRTKKALDASRAAEPVEAS